MEYKYYFRLIKYIKNRHISYVLAYVLSFYDRFKLIARFIKHKPRYASMSCDAAQKTIKDIYYNNAPDPEYFNPQIDDTLDLSIVIPVYNYADLIEANILSVINQKTRYRYEAIFVDDGSTDGARDILLKYKDTPNVRIILQDNKGIAGARNTGINHANGRYLMFIDCDDVIHNDLVETLMSHTIDNEHEEDIVMCAHNLVKIRNGNIYNIIPNVYMPIKNSHDKKSYLNYPGLPWCKVYKRELWDNVRYFPSYWYEDSIIHWLIFTQCRSFKYLTDIEYDYKWYEKNFSHIQGNNSNPKALDRYWLLIKILKQYDKLGLPYDQTFYILLLRHVGHYFYSNISGLGPQVEEACFVKLKQLLKHYNLYGKYKLPLDLKLIEKAFKTNDIELWKIAS